MTSTDDSGNVATKTAVPTQTRRLHWWVAGITFVVGFVAGVITVGLLNAGTPEFGTQAGSGGGAATPSAPVPTGSVPVVAEARVNAACLSVINEAQDTYTVLTALPPAVTDVDLQALDDIVRRLQPIQARLGRDLQDCRVDTTIQNPTASAVPEPTPPQSTATATR